MTRRSTPSTKTPRMPIPTWYFALVVVRSHDKYLLVQEAKHGQRWYLPAGRAEPGETLFDAARRETLEEAGVQVKLDGIIRFEHQAKTDSSRIRAIFSAVPVGNEPPKTVADKHSLQARWWTLEEMGQLDLRGFEVVEMCAHVERGGPLAPLNVLAAEGAAFES